MSAFKDCDPCRALLFISLYLCFLFSGKLIKRQRLPKNDRGDNWHWKDINLGMNVTFYGKVFRVVNCDKFTSLTDYALCA